MYNEMKCIKMQYRAVSRINIKPLYSHCTLRITPAHWNHIAPLRHYNHIEPLK